VVDVRRLRLAANARTPDRAPERLLLLVGMAGFLVTGLAIRIGFDASGSSASGIAFGLGYLTVVAVHTTLYYRANRNIIRIAPFNLASALLVLAAGVTGGPAAYLLTAAALALQVIGPLISGLGGRFEVRPSHFAERHGALVIVALAAGVRLTIGQATQPTVPGRAAALGAGVALFLAGHAAFRWVLRTGPAWPRLVTAGFALATAALGALIAVEAQMVVLLAGLVGLLAAERRWTPAGRDSQAG